MPKNVYLDEEEILHWDKVDNATSYVVLVGNKSFDTIENSMDLFEILNEYKTYEIEVYAISSDKKYLESDSAFLNYTLEENKLKYELKDNEYVVSAQDSKNIKGKVIIPEYYNDKPVTEIKSKAFENCTDLISALIPRSINTFGSNIFMNCTKLLRVKLDDDLAEIPQGLFFGCTSLNSTCFPKSVKIIKNNAYKGCSSLKNIYIPDGVEIISGAFQSCSNLESISFPESIKLKISPEYFYFSCNLQSIEIRGNNELYYTENNCLIEKATKKLIMGCCNSIIPTDVKSIGRRAFYTRNIESIDIGENVEIIEEEAFLKCYKLQNANINGVKEIGNSCFEQCSNLKSVCLNNVDTIDAKAFFDCKSLESINLECVKRVKENAFTNCTNLNEIIFSHKLEELKYFNTKTSTNVIFNNNDYYIFENSCIIDKRTYTLIKGENHSTIPDYVKIIGEYSFKDCTFHSIEIPNSVEIIDKYAFSNCLFETITFPKSLKRIEESAFYNCPNLLYVTIPSNVEFIGSNAFDVPNIMTVIFDGFDGILESGAFPYHTVYTDIACEDYLSMDHFGTRPFGDVGESGEFAIYNTTFKEDDGKKYVYSIDLKNISSSVMDIGYAICYRDGYKLIGWSFTENNNEVDISIAIVERDIYYDGTCVGKRKFYGFTKLNYMEKQKEHKATVLYAVWKKI
ncbi:MAG: leucine-rich repeat domain-containing protein [Staphylococcus sp.]|nr:leucine-rich repeat domain-containing protein [Staphylococcus sp.]